MPVRKIVQIAVIPVSNDSRSYLFALCNDSTVWCRQNCRSEDWFEVNPIPQPEEENVPIQE